MAHKIATVGPTNATATVKNNKRKLKISKRVTIFKVVRCLRFILGHYTELTSSKLKAFLIKCCSILLAVIIIYAPLKYIKMAYVMGLIEYLLFVLLSLFTGDEYFYKFHNSIKSIDVLMGYKRGKIIDSNAIIFLLSVITIMRIVIIYCRSTVLAFRFTIIGVYLAIFSLRISYMLITVIFFAMYHRMKFLRKKFEIITIPVTIIGKQKVASKIRLIRKYLINYHHLLDCLRDINGGLQYFVSFIFTRFVMTDK